MHLSLTIITGSRPDQPKTILQDRLAATAQSVIRTQKTLNSKSISHLGNEHWQTISIIQIVEIKTQWRQELGLSTILRFLTITKRHLSNILIPKTSHSADHLKKISSKDYDSSQELEIIFCARCSRLNLCGSFKELMQGGQLPETQQWPKNMRAI
jgi:hypothetical protein